MNSGIFINYRRQDTIATAGRLYDRLAKAFGKKQIFTDVDHIPAGADFVHHIEAELAKCGIVLALIGPHWLDVRDETGSRRLLDLHDLVSNEIAVALRQGVNVIPVLVDGASMPKHQELPDALKPLARRNAVELRNVQFGADAEQLIGRISKLLSKHNAAIRAKHLIIAGTALVAAMLIWVISTFIPITGIRWTDTKVDTKVDSVESCGLTGPIQAGVNFSGVYAGVVVDSSGAEVQLKLVRDQNSVKGRYLRAGICGSVAGTVTGNQMTFSWDWASNSGRGVATQAGDSLSATSGFGNATEGGGTLILVLRKPR